MSNYFLMLRFSTILFSSSRLNFEFILNRGKPTETKYTFATRESLHGPIEYNKSHLKVSSSREKPEFYSLISSTKMIMSSGLFINLNLGRLNLPSAFYHVCVGGFFSLLFIILISV